MAGLMLWASALAAAAHSQAPTVSTGAATAAKEKEETCRISGMVVKLADGVPLKNATIQLENPEDREHTIATRSRSDGRFELRKIPAGRYKLIVTRSGSITKATKRSPVSRRA